MDDGATLPTTLANSYESRLARMVHNTRSPGGLTLAAGLASAGVSLGICAVSYQVADIHADRTAIWLVMWLLPVIIPLVLVSLFVFNLVRLASSLHQRTQQLESEVERRRAAEERLEVLATVDDLTQVVNRRAFFGRAAEITAAAPEPTCVVVIDIDNFKTLNDTHGHAAGDEALRQFGDLLRTSMPYGAVVGRLGGEEFGLILPDSGCDETRGVCERIREGTTQIRAGLTSSFGITDWSPGQESIDTALARADAGLYRAKQRGRNRIELVRKTDAAAGILSDMSPVARR